ncbi:MAG: hypothetical protein ABI421_00690 [Polyangiaceae bacterium]
MTTLMAGGGRIDFHTHGELLIATRTQAGQTHQATLTQVDEQRPRD